MPRFSRWLLLYCSLLFSACQPMSSTAIANSSLAPSSKALPEPAPESRLEYQTQNLAQAVVHVVKIPAGARFEVVPAVAEEVATVEEFAAMSGAVAVINAGYFDPANRQTTSYITVNRSLVADPRQNERLMGNPNLTRYLSQILNRSEFRRYQCGAAVRYAIAFHNDPLPGGCGLVDAIAAGPQLLPLTLEVEGFTASVDGRVVRDAIGSDRPNARSAVGITADGSVLLVMVAQRSEVSGSSGMSLPQVASVLQGLGAVQALNLDGGSSASLFYDGRAFYGKVSGAEGDRVRRPVKSALVVRMVGASVEAMP